MESRGGVSRQNPQRGRNGAWKLVNYAFLVNRPACYTVSMQHISFYGRLLGIGLLAGLIIYSAVTGIRFLYYRHIGLQLRNQPKQVEYTVGQGQPLTQVAVLGDSTAYGVGASEYRQTYHFQYLASQPGKFHVTNYGGNGARVMDLPQQLAQVGRVDVMFISIVGNDITHLTNVSDLESQLDGVLSEAEQKAKLVILITPGSFEDAFILPWPLRQVLVWRGGSVSTLAKQVAAQHPRVISIDLFSQPESAFAQNPSLYFSTDFFHPSDAGYTLWAQTIAREVEAAGGLTINKNYELK